MAKKTKEETYYKIIDKNIVMTEKNTSKLSDEDIQKIKFYVSIGYNVVFVEDEPKKKRSFTTDKARSYIKKHDKDGLEAFDSIKEPSIEASAKLKALKAAAAAAEAEGASEEVKAAAPTTEQLREASAAATKAGRQAFQDQRKFFIDRYGEEAYEEVVNS